MKKILAISGSQRKQGSGIKAFTAFKAHFNEDEYAFELLHLSDYDMNACTGCTACFKTINSVCPLKDQVSEIVSKWKRQMA